MRGQKWYQKRPPQDSNSESLPPEGNALSIRPGGRKISRGIASIDTQRTRFLASRTLLTRFDVDDAMFSFFFSRVVKKLQASICKMLGVQLLPTSSSVWH